VQYRLAPDPVQMVWQTPASAAITPRTVIIAATANKTRIGSSLSGCPNSLIHFSVAVDSFRQPFQHFQNLLNPLIPSVF